MEEQISKALTQVHEILEKFRDKFQENNEKLNSLDLVNFKIETLLQRTEDLEKWVIKGSNSPSLQSRVSSIENSISNISKDVSDIKEFIEKTSTDKKKIKQGYFMALISFLSTLVTALFAYFK